MSQARPLVTQLLGGVACSHLIVFCPAAKTVPFPFLSFYLCILLDDVLYFVV